MAGADDTIEVIMRELVDKIEQLIPNVKHRKLLVLKNKDTLLHDEVLNLSHYLDLSTNLTTRLKFISAGHTSLLKCKTCGNEHQHLNDRKEISEYCSGNCYLKDKNKDTSKFKFIDQTEKVRKMKETNKEKYGHEFNSQRKEIKTILSENMIKKYNKQYYEYINNYDWLYENYINKKMTTLEMANIIGSQREVISNALIQFNIPIRKYINRSSIERDIENFIISLGENIEYKTSYKCDKYELDLYFPNHQFAIEVNGLYWHSETDGTNKSKNRHIFKYNLCKDNDIVLYQFTDEMWLYKKNICQSMILNKLKLNNKIYARKCIIKEISYNLYKEFCEENHISGFSNASVRIGLYLNNELLQIMSFSKPRFDNSHEWEIIRLCSKLNTYVIGGTSKMFQYFIKKYTPKNIISYSDNQYGTGNVYAILGFTKIGQTEIGYKWTDKYKTYNRMKFQKHKLKDLLKIYDDELSEKDNMINNGYRYYWDCGNNIWIYKNPLVNQY